MKQEKPGLSDNQSPNYDLIFPSETKPFSNFTPTQSTKEFYQNKKSFGLQIKTSSNLGPK